jgi:ABC-type ATPase involved in cell division
MASEIIDVVKDIWTRGTTVILATHQARLALRLKQRMLVLEAGRIVKDG